MCGLLKDRHGVSRQIVPAVLGAMKYDAGAAGTERAMQAILQMTKNGINTLQLAYGDR